MLRSMERVALALWCSWAVSAGTAGAAYGADAADTPGPEEQSGLVTLGQDLTLVVTEDGPDQPWTLSLANQGSQALGLIADPGLLWFEVTLPGRAPQTCLLPEPLRPTGMQRKNVLELNPGEHFSRRFDPRFFCFAELGQLLLVPGARVTPHFGWPREAPTGKKTKTKLKTKPATTSSAAPLQAPFVAWRWPQVATSSSASSGTPASSERGEENTESEAGELGSSTPTPSPWRWPTEGVKSVQGATLELPASYASWIGAPRRDPPRDLELVMIAGSDAEDERTATVTIGLINPLDRPQPIFVRRELLDYDVHGPDGFFQCTSSDVGSPDFASFSTLAPHAAERLTVRLIELCPRRSFARPGLYEVHARLAAKWSGQDLGLDAFVGELDAAHPAFVRVRSGDRSSFARLVVAGGGNAGAGASEGEGLDVTPDSATPDDAPADHDPQGTPDEAPAAPSDVVPMPVPAPPVE